MEVLSSLIFLVAVLCYVVHQMKREAKRDEQDLIQFKNALWHYWGSQLDDVDLLPSDSPGWPDPPLFSAPDDSPRSLGSVPVYRADGSGS